MGKGREQKTAAMEDFWPNDIGASTVKSPAEIMRLQAEALALKTGRAVLCEVETFPSEGGDIVHVMSLIVPSLANYRYELLRVSHGVNIYPLQAKTHVPLRSKGIPLPIPASRKIEDEQNFLSWLKLVLSSDKTREIISNLLAHVRR